MTPIKLLALAALVTAGLGVPPAGAAGGPPKGRLCSYDDDVYDPTAPDRRTGVLDGGPVYADGAAAVTLRCSIHVNDAKHSGPATVEATSVTGPGATALGPRPVTFTAGEDDYVIVCTEVTVDGTTWYWDWGWTTDPAAWCGSRPYDLPEPLVPLADYLGCVSYWGLAECPDYPLWEAYVDPYVCPVVAPYDPDEQVWNCPPYWDR